MDSTRKNVKVVFLISLLCGGCLLIVWNLFQMLSERPRVLLALLPEEVEIQEAVPEGSVFQTEFTLENKTRTDITVTKLMSSCGCTALFTKEGQPIAVPLVLSPSRPFAIQVVVNTKNKTGKNVASIVVPYEYKGESFVSAGKILFDVLPVPSDEYQEN